MWDVSEAAADQHAAQTPGTFDLDCLVNEQTGIFCAGLPVYRQDKPMHGTKAARNSILKLLAGMCDDFNPLHLRTKYEVDGVTLDVYFKVAPGWSTLSGGRNPIITRKPEDIAEKLIRACDCVPFVRSVRLFIVDASGNKTRVTLEELTERNIAIKQVPNLHKKPLAGPSQSAAPSVDITPVMERQQALEKELGSMRAQLAETVAVVGQVAEMKTLLETLLVSTASAPASASTSASASASAPADDEVEEVPATVYRGKRVRRV